MVGRVKTWSYSFHATPSYTRRFDLGCTLALLIGSPCVHSPMLPSPNRLILYFFAFFGFQAARNGTNGYFFFLYLSPNSSR
jgi:hypothetical protein